MTCAAVLAAEGDGRGGEPGPVDRPAHEFDHNKVSGSWLSFADGTVRWIRTGP